MKLDMVLENVIELDNGKKNKLETILLNGTQICIIVPGGEIIWIIIYYCVIIIFFRF